MIVENSTKKTVNPKGHFVKREYVMTLIFVTALFLLWGMALTMGDVLNKHFQNVLQVSKSDSALVKMSIFGAYAIMALPAGYYVERFGFKNGVLLGLILYALGAFLFIPASDLSSFSLFRIALFVLGCGLATLETVAHPFIVSLGSQDSSDQRLNLAHAFNGLGGVLGLLIGGYFIFGTKSPESQNLDSVKNLYTIIGCFIGMVAVAFTLLNVPASLDLRVIKGERRVKSSGIFTQRHFVWAIIAQFFNAAAQGGTWAFFINYGSEVMHFSDETVAYYFAFSMALKMLGRFIGTYLIIRYISSNRLLTICAACNILMCLMIAQSWGSVSFIALILLNFFFSIMTPTIFSLGLKNLGGHIKQGSSYIVMGVAGGAIFPPLMGLVADHNIAYAYYLPVICYAVVCMYGYNFYQVRG